CTAPIPENERSLLQRALQRRRGLFINCGPGAERRAPAYPAKSSILTESFRIRSTGAGMDLEEHCAGQRIPSRAARKLRFFSALKLNLHSRKPPPIPPTRSMRWGI